MLFIINIFYYDSHILPILTHHSYSSFKRHVAMPSANGNSPGHIIWNQAKTMLDLANFHRGKKSPKHDAG